MLAPRRGLCLPIKNAEATSRNDGRDVAAAEPERRVQVEGGICRQTRAVIVGVNRILGYVIGEDRIVGRERRRHQLIDADPCAYETPVEPLDEPGRVAHL